MIAVIGALAVAASTWIYAAGLTYGGEPPIRSDGLGYYVYLPAVFLDHDVTMVRTAARSFGNDPTNIPGVNLVSTRSGGVRPLDKYGIGEAVMMAPFFGVGDALAVITSEPRDGFSWPYQAADNAAGLVYASLGLMLTALVLRRWFSLGTVIVTTLAITFGAALFQYATYDASYSHAYSFFLVALIMWLTLTVWEKPRLPAAAALGASVGLLGLVRLTNLGILVFCLLVGVGRRSDLSARALSLVRRFDLVAIGAGVCLLTLLPQFAYWYRITGRPFVNSYAATGEHLDLLHPHLIGVLFSVRKGLFFWTPLLMLAVSGLPFLHRTARAVFAPAVVYLIVMTWIVSSWSIWWYGGSFGMRALIDEMPVFALGLAALYESARRGAARRVLNVSITLTTLLAVHGMLSYWLKTIPIDQVTFREYLDSFGHY